MENEKNKIPHLYNIDIVMCCNINIHKGNSNKNSGCLKWNRKTKEVFNEDEKLIGMGKIYNGIFTVYNP